MKRTLSSQQLNNWAFSLKFVKTLDDAVGLLIFGYDDNALSIVDEWIETDKDGENAEYLGFRLGDIRNKLENYYE